MTSPINPVDIIIRVQTFFRDNIVRSHIEGGLLRASKLSEYNLHPFLYKYLANFLEGNNDPRSIAKILLYPRALGTSITTIFGMHAQKMIPAIFSGMGSAVHGIDIEFIDAVDNRKKYCQLKSGPNTINSPDVITVKNHFRDIKRLARTNDLDVGDSDLIVGVLYGVPDDLSSHYLKIAEDYPVVVGAEFWHHLTGRERFYYELIDAIGEVALEVDAKEQVEAAIDRLAAEIESAGL